MAAMRAKMRVSRVENFSETSERLHFSAVSAKQYPSDGSDENNTFAKFTPSADLSMSITNPALVGKFTEGEEYYLDFTKV
jgi:hypothetical protein